MQTTIGALMAEPAKEFKTIKVALEYHRRLAVLAANEGIKISELLERLFRGPLDKAWAEYQKTKG